MSTVARSDRCISPLNGKGHIGNDLRLLSKNLKRRFPDLPDNSKICSKCRKLCGSPISSIGTRDNEGNNEYENMDIETTSENTGIDKSVQEATRSAREIELEDMFSELKEKFSSLAVSDPLKLTILTIAPSTWNISRISREFNTSRHLVRKSKKLKADGGILATTTAKHGKTLSKAVIEVIVECYNNDLHSRVMPGRKDTVSVIIDGKRTQVQKRLLYFDLRELYELFKIAEPTVQVGFSTFAKLRPKHCVLAGARGTHSVCVCTIHQNCKLMLDAIDIQKFTKNQEDPICSYKDCLQQIMCKNSTPDCHLDECSKCPGSENLTSRLLEILDGANISQIEYCAWSGTDRSTLQNLTLPVQEFVDELYAKLAILKPHSYIAKEQGNFIAQTKNNLGNGKVLVMFDYSENYSFAVQDASQAFHFNNDQCTVFPAIYYYKEDSELKHESCVFLANSLKHDTSSVYTIQNLSIPEIKRKVKKLKKIIYVTDGAKQHFKNRFQIANLLHHEKDFGIEAEWHFCATAHGKSCYDGLGAIFKREAYRASLKAKPKDAILTHTSLVKWAKNHFENIRIFYFTQTEHDKFKRKLNRRFQDALPVPQILKHHSFQLSSDGKVIMKRYSNAAKSVSVLL